MWNSTFKNGIAIEEDIQNVLHFKLYLYSYLTSWNGAKKITYKGLQIYSSGSVEQLIPRFLNRVPTEFFIHFPRVSLENPIIFPESVENFYYSAPSKCLKIKDYKHKHT